MKEKELLRLEQMDAALALYKGQPRPPRPRLGWVRTIREALGMTNVQLARRIQVRAPQSVEDMQTYEASGTIKLNTLEKLAHALECDLEYFLVPKKPLGEIRRQQAIVVAQRLIRKVSHSMRLEEQGISRKLEEAEVQRRIEQLLTSESRALWD